VIEIRPAAERGHTHLDWLDSRHTFSFDQYYDPRHMGFGVLRVINDDRVAPGAGFPRHHHRDMEIVTYMMEGALEHRDSLGSGSLIRPGEVQRMSAGAGIMHSEFNASKTEPAHLLQIWIRPRRTGLDPSYEQRFFAPERLQGRLCLLASGRAAADALRIEQDIEIYGVRLDAGQSAAHRPATGRHVWVQVARGSIDLNGRALEAGDGAAAGGEVELLLGGLTSSEVILFDMN